MELLACITLYFRCFWHYLLGQRSKYNTAFQSLIQKHSYRLVARAHKDPLIGFRYFKKAMQLIWQKEDRSILWDKQSGYAVYDAAFFFVDHRKSYAETVSGKKLKLFLNKEELGIEKSFVQKLFESLLLGLFFILLFPFTLLLSNRGSLALNLLEVLECARLIQHLEKQDITYLFYFCPFNKDANYAALRLQEKGIYCHKISSSNPLGNFYQRVIADKFAFSAPFQHGEYEELKKNWYVEETDNWPVYQFQVIQPLIKDYEKPEKNTLGFISSGIWRRREVGHISVGVGDHEAELQLIDFLKGYLRRHKDIAFYIFLHPIEKKSETVYQKALAYYRQEFEGIDLHFFDREAHTFSLFDKVDTSIAAYSSTNLERLYAGFKTLYAPLNMRLDYYSGNAIEHIAAFNENELEPLLNKTLKQSTADFFSKYHLTEYHHEHFSYLFERDQDN